MKCQKNRSCVKQPANALPDNRPKCTGCDKTGKDKTETKEESNMSTRDIATELERVLNQVCLGYEDNMSFSEGYLRALKIHKIICGKEYNKLIKVYSNYKNGDGRWFINKQGELEEDLEAEVTED